MLTEGVSRRSLPAWLWPAVLTALIVLASVAGQGATEVLRYQREAVFDGQLWRLATAHLVHLGPAHTAMNLAGLWLIWWLFRAQGAALALTALVGGAAGMAVGFLFLEPALGWYVGLSGILHGLLAAQLPVNFAKDRLETLVLAVGLLAKLIYEQGVGALPFTEAGAGGPVVVDAHLYGAVGGLAVGVSWWIRGRRRALSQPPSQPG